MATVPDIADADRLVGFTAIASQVDFLVTWPVFATDNTDAMTTLRVTVDGVEENDWSFVGTVVLNLTDVFDGGTITRPTALTGSEAIVIWSDSPAKRDSDFIEGAAFPATTQDRVLNRIFANQRDDQQRREAIIRRPFNETTRDMKIPKESLRAGKYLGFGATGEPVVLEGPAGGGGDVTLADLAASTGSGLIGHIASGAGATTQTVRTFMRDRVSVRDYGAVGDGVSDDAGAINATITETNANGGKVFFPPGIYKQDSELLIIESTILSGSGRGGSGPTVLKPSAETFAAIRLNAAVDLACNNIVIEDIRIESASQATNPLAKHIYFDDSGGANRHPYHVTLRNIVSLNAYDSFFDDTIAWNVLVEHFTSVTAGNKGLNAAGKTAGTNYSLSHFYVKDPVNIGIDISNVGFLFIDSSAIDNMNNAFKAMQLTTCRGVINTFDLETNITSNAGGLLGLSNCNLDINGLGCASNTLSTAGAAVVVVDTGGRIVFNAGRITTTTGPGSGASYGLNVKTGVELVINDGLDIDAPTGGGTPLRLLDADGVYRETRTGEQTLTGAGAVDITSLTTHIVTTGADALTLADGDKNQEKIIIMKTDGGDGTLTPANLANGSTITFDDVGDSARLWFTNGAWHFMGGTATLA